MTTKESQQNRVEVRMPQRHAVPHDWPEKVQLPERPHLRETGAHEMYLSVTPVSSAAPLVLFCNTIQQNGTADIAYFSSSANGTAIKLALRSRTPILDILGSMDEVEKIWEDPALNLGENWGVPTFYGLSIQRSARITLKEC